MIKRSDKAIDRYQRDNWIHVKCNNLDKFDYEMLKNIEEPWFCISCTSKYLTFCNRNNCLSTKIIAASTNLFHHNELFQLIKNLKILTDELSNDNTNFFHVRSKYRNSDFFCNLQSNIKKYLNIPLCLFSNQKL